MNKKLLSTNIKNFNVSQIVESVSELSNTAYYVFLGNHTPYVGGDTSVPTPNNSVRGLLTTAYEDMISGKRVSSSDVAYMVRRVNWTSGTVYAAYDDNIDLSGTNYYVVTDSGAKYYVFKCLYNNNGAASTVEPNFNDTSADDSFFTTSDGYNWKYMYSVDKSTFNKFATRTYMPVFPDANVSGNAVAGSIDNIIVVSGGQFYNNYYDGRFNLDDLKIGGDQRKFNIGKDASSISGFYYNSFIYIVEGTGKGQYKRIVGYDVSLTTKQITVESRFDIDLDATSRYEITPWVVITGDGSETVNCVARALVNTQSSNSIYKIEVLNSGAGYLDANAKISVSSNVGVTNTASLRVILPPYGGHGYDPIKELNSNVLGISVKFANSESNTISTSNDYRTIGLIKDPAFANVELSLLDESDSPGYNGTFLDNEGLVQYRNFNLAGNVDVSSTSTTVTGTGTYFDETFKPGDRILIKTGTSHFLSNVISITNSTSLTVASNCSFTNSAAEVCTVEITATGNVESTTDLTINVTNLRGIIEPGLEVIGLTSYATGYIDSYEISNQSKNFNTFSQLYKFNYNTVTGSFADDELIVQTATLGTEISDDSSARYHSIDTTNKIVYVTNKFGIFNANSATGSTSGSTINISSVEPGDLVPGSGEVLYLEYLEPISRSNTQSETIKILVEY